MDGLEVTSGFELYELFRYFLPGLVLVFLLLYGPFYEFGSLWKFEEKVVFGLVVGTMINSIGLYKFLPNVTKIRKRYHETINELMRNAEDIYLRWDLIEILLMDSHERKYFRKYLGLGIFKLDTSAILLIISVLSGIKLIYMILFLYNWKNSLNLYIYIVMIFIPPIFSYILYDNGISDLIRALNIKILAAIRANYYDDNRKLDRIVAFLDYSKKYLLYRNRRLLNPTDILTRIRNKLMDPDEER